jgi:hypothetical protein
MSSTEPLLPLLAFLRVRAGEHQSVVVDDEYLGGRRVVLLPRFAMYGEHDHADAIGLEFGQAVELRRDIVIGTAEQLERLRRVFESYRAEEASDPEAVAFWESLIAPLGDDAETAPAAESNTSVVAGWFAWHTTRAEAVHQYS